MAYSSVGKAPSLPSVVPRRTTVSTNATSSEKRKTNWRERLAEHATWTFEVLAALVSIASLAAIVGVLRYYDTERLDSWNLQVATADQTVHISLNTVVSLLGTLCKSTIAVVLEAAISQLKWNWFNGVRRPLRDFELFDQASRGPKGSAKLVWRTKGVRLVSIGAFLTVLSVTFDPFLQLLVNYDTQQVPVSDTGALMPYAQSYRGGKRLQKHNINIQLGGQEYESYFEQDPRVVAAINNGLWSKDARLKPNYACQSGNCTWPTQVSLAVCSKCYDVSHQLKKDEVSSDSVSDDGAATSGGPPNLRWTLTGGSGITIINTNNEKKSGGVDSTIMNVTATVFPNETISFQKSQNLLVSLAALVVNSSYYNGDTLWEDTPVTATECGLELCAVTYDTSVIKSNYTEKIGTLSTERVPTSYAINDTRGKDLLVDGVYNGSDWNPLGPAVQGSDISRTAFEVQLSKDQQNIAGVSSFPVDQNSTQSMVWSFITVFKPSNFTQLNGEAQSLADVGHNDQGFNKSYQRIYFMNDLLNYDSPTMQALYAADSIDSLFSNLATDLSATIRNGGPGGTSGPSLNTGKTSTVQQLHGTDLISTTIIEVRWQFIVVPVLVCVVGTIFLIASMVQTKLQNMPVWKEHAMPTLVWGVDEDTRQQIRDEWRIHGKGSGTHIRAYYHGNRAGGELAQ